MISQQLHFYRLLPSGSLSQEGALDQQQKCSLLLEVTCGRRRQCRYVWLRQKAHSVLHGLVTSASIPHRDRKQKLTVSFRPQPWKWHGVTFSLWCLSEESLDSRDNGWGHRLPLSMGRICKNFEAAFQDYHISLNVISLEKSCRPSSLKQPCPLLESLSIMIPL